MWNKKNRRRTGSLGNLWEDKNAYGTGFHSKLFNESDDDDVEETPEPDESPEETPEETPESEEDSDAELDDEPEETPDEDDEELEEAISDKDREAINQLIMVAKGLSKIENISVQEAVVKIMGELETSTGTNKKASSIKRAVEVADRHKGSGGVFAKKMVAGDEVDIEDELEKKKLSKVSETKSTFSKKDPPEVKELLNMLGNDPVDCISALYDMVSKRVKGKNVDKDTVSDEIERIASVVLESKKYDEGASHYSSKVPSIERSVGKETSDIDRVLYALGSSPLDGMSQLISILLGKFGEKKPTEAQIEKAMKDIMRRQKLMKQGDEEPEVDEKTPEQIAIENRKRKEKELEEDIDFEKEIERTILQMKKANKSDEEIVDALLSNGEYGMDQIASVWVNTIKEGCEKELTESDIIIEELIKEMALVTPPEPTDYIVSIFNNRNLGDVSAVIKDISPAEAKEIERNLKKRSSSSTAEYRLSKGFDPGQKGAMVLLRAILGKDDIKVSGT